jgi:lipid II stem peptide D-isoglutamate amidotransferase MurT-like protein
VTHCPPQRGSRPGRAAPWGVVSSSHDFGVAGQTSATSSARPDTTLPAGCECGVGSPNGGDIDAPSAGVSPRGPFAGSDGRGRTGESPVTSRIAAELARPISTVRRWLRAIRGTHPERLRTSALNLLALNPAGWSEMVRLLDPAAARLFVVNNREADGRDTSWLWDVSFELLGGQDTTVVAAEEKAADLGLRLDYARVDHVTVSDPLAALAALPVGKVDVVATYTAFHALTRRLQTDPAGPT